MVYNYKLIAIVGPTASGKSLFAKNIARTLGYVKTNIISQDQYYKDWSKIPIEEREKINFDHPNAFDFDLLKKHLVLLKRGKPVFLPRYSYKLHKRLKQVIKITPKKWIIIEGLLVLYKRALSNMFDLKIYLDINEAFALSRRIKRDVKHRGETIESVCSRYFKDVLPMQKKFVEPQKKFADIIINGNINSHKLLRGLIQKCRKSKR